MGVQTSELSYKGLEPFFEVNSSSNTTGFTFPIPPATGSNSPSSYLLRYSCQFTVSGYAVLQFSFRNASNSDLQHYSTATSAGSQNAQNRTSSPAYCTYWGSQGRPGGGSASGTGATGNEAWIYVHNVQQSEPNGKGVRCFQFFTESRGGGNTDAGIGGGIFYNYSNVNDHATQVRFSASSGNMYSIHAASYSLGQMT